MKTIRRGEWMKRIKYQAEGLHKANQKTASKSRRIFISSVNGALRAKPGTRRYLAKHRHLEAFVESLQAFASVYERVGDEFSLGNWSR